MNPIPTSSPFGPAPSSSPPKQLRRSTARVTKFPGAADFPQTDRQVPDHPPPAYPEARSQQVTVDLDMSFILPGDFKEKDSWHLDASRVAARRAMAKRNSRASMQNSRRKSWRKPKHGISRPQIKVDTSFTRYQRNTPRQLFPYKSPSKSATKQGSIVGFITLSDLAALENSNTPKKNGWWPFGKGVSKSRDEAFEPQDVGQNGQSHQTESLAGNGFQFKSKTMRSQGITQGTGLFSTTTQELAAADTTVITPTTTDQTRPAGSKQTVGSLTPNRYMSIEVSPSDRPIPIGISIPSDSLSAHGSYVMTRERSESDTTLVTPSIIITPAMVKSVWSPDSEVDYRPRPASSIYSQATIYPSSHSYDQDVPPVPALPSNVLGSGQDAKVGGAANRVVVENERAAETTPNFKVTHSRNSTRDSTMTAFEEDEDSKRKDRVMSTSTLFEEDQTPLAPHEKDIKVLSSLKIDTTSSPSTYRLSRGWWNVITTPFEMSRSNSIWTRRTIGNGDMTPDVPSLPHRTGLSPDLIPTPSTYIWSATEKSPSVNGTSNFHDFRTLAFPHSSPTSALSPHATGHNSLLTPISTADREVPILLGADPQPTRTILQSNNFYLPSLPENIESHQGNRRLPDSASIQSVTDNDMRSPTSVGTVSTPVLGVASIGTVLVPREIHERQRPMSDIPEVDDRQRQASSTNETGENQRQMGDPYDTHAMPFTGTNSAPTANVTEHQPPRQHLASPPPPPPAYSRYISEPSNQDPVLVEEAARGSVPLDPFPPPHQEQSKERRTNRLGRKKQQERKRRNRRICCWGCCCIIILALVALIVALTVTLTRRHKAPPIQPSQWLNLTGYPPIPTGMSTIAQPEAVVENSGCVAPATIWSCALPKEEQASNAPSKPDQPNMRLEISFVNGSVANSSMTQTSRRRRDLDQVSNPVSAGSFVRSRLLKIRGQLPIPSPAAPSLDDQKFLGNTTDGNTSPFEGEQTPFYISFIDPTKVISARLAKRSSNPFQNITSLIPPPSVNSDGTAAAASLLPLPSSQPLRLYNRGLPTEHYGFYTYFDRSIFLKSIEPTNSSFGGVPADTNGGSSFDSATLRCTWAQTRFLVQIWTNAGNSKPLLQGATATSSSTPSPTATGNSSANDFTRPGSFPYPVTITLDRHGGSEKEKMIYCYGMDTNGKIIDSDKSFVLEDRSFGGVLVNPTQGPFDNVTISPADGGPGGIDGGTGGCQCQWANWLQS